MRKIIQSVQFAFTVTLLPSLYRKTPEQQFDETHYDLYSLLKPFCPDDFTMVAELTERGCNVHYHGVLTMRYDPRLFIPKVFTNLFRGSKRYGHVLIKQIDDLPGWIAYIKKAIPTTSQVINRPPIIDDHLNHLKMDLGYYQSFVQ